MVSPVSERASCGVAADRDDREVQPEPIVYREEVTAIVGALADLLVELRMIRSYFFEEEEEEEEDDLEE